MMTEPENKILINKRVDDRVKEMLPKYLQLRAFTDKKITDTPTDSLEVVNRRYVQLNGTLANRPIGSVATMGQFYFATNLNSGTPIRFNANSSVWTDGVGSIVASN